MDNSYSVPTGNLDNKTHNGSNFILLFCFCGNNASFTLMLLIKLSFILAVPSNCNGLGVL